MDRHELAHKLIFTQCYGAWEGPDVEWPDRIGEGVTNSYAKLFLGAPAADLGGEGEYLMTAETDARAQAIHEGDLGCFDDGMPPGA